jgi:glycogen debranching enzyme
MTQRRIARAEQVRRSFNERFWYAEGGYLYDVIDGEAGRTDPKCRPNQIFAIALPHPVLLEHRWEPVMRVVRDRLATPVGLRSLAPGDVEYKSRYFGDPRARCRYHQGTVWAWLAGPHIDAWLKVYPDDWAGRSACSTASCRTQRGLHRVDQRSVRRRAPYTPRGCIAQAWSVAEVLRVWVKLAQRAQQPAQSSSDVVTV